MQNNFLFSPEKLKWNPTIAKYVPRSERAKSQFFNRKKKKVQPRPMASNNPTTPNLAFDLKAIDINNPSTYTHLDPSTLANAAVNYQYERSGINQSLQDRASKVAVKQDQLDKAISISNRYTTDKDIHNAAASLEHQAEIRDDIGEYTQQSDDEIELILTSQTGATASEQVVAVTKQVDLSSTRPYQGLPATEQLQNTPDNTAEESDDNISVADTPTASEGQESDVRPSAAQKPNYTDICHKVIIDLANTMKSVTDIERGCYKYPVDSANVILQTKQIFSGLHNLIKNEINSKVEGMGIKVSDAIIDLMQMYITNQLAAANTQGLLVRKYELLQEQFHRMEQNMMRKIDALQLQLDASNDMFAKNTADLNKAINAMTQQACNISSYMHIINDSLNSQQYSKTHDAKKMDIPTITPTGVRVPVETPQVPDDITVSHKKWSGGLHALICGIEHNLTNTSLNTIQSIANAFQIRDIEKLVRRVERVRIGLTARQWTDAQLAILVMPTFPKLRESVPNVYEYFQEIYDAPADVKYVQLTEALNDAPIMQSNIVCKPITGTIPKPIEESKSALFTYHAAPWVSSYHNKP